LAEYNASLTTTQWNTQTDTVWRSPETESPELPITSRAAALNPLQKKLTADS
jgi:hypothetical protein